MQVITRISESIVNHGSSEIPVVAALVRDGDIISICSNEVESTLSAWRHAEFCVIEKCIASLNSKFLDDYDIYVTLEPCNLCMALIDAVRIRNVYFGAYSKKYGSLFYEPCAQTKNIIGGFFELDNSRLLRKYFYSIRNASD